MSDTRHVPHVKHRQHRTPGPSKKKAAIGASAKPKRKAPTPLPPDHAGVDRKDFPHLKKPRERPRNADDFEWMRRLFTLSNVRFCGAYVCGPPPARHSKLLFTSESRDVDRAWLPNVVTLADQGWGIVFWYMGYNLKNPPKAKPHETDRKRGVLHGRHLRESLAALGPSWAGGVVVIDQEDDSGTKLPKFMLDYYRGLFDEMSRPDPDLPAYRPGMYCRLADIPPLVVDRPDLFLWEVKYDTPRDTTAQSPCETNEPGTRTAARRLVVLSAKRTISAALVAHRQTTPWIVWAMGRQFCRYVGPMPPLTPVLPKQNPPWPATSDTRDWDFDTALVRNPAFPVAEPRLSAAVHAGGVVLLRGSFRPPVSSPASAAHPPMMDIEQMTLPRPTTLPRTTGKSPAPEAPMLLLHRPNELLAVTVLQGSRLGISARNDQATPKKWSALDTLPGNNTDVRRLYALAGVTLAPDDVQIYFAGTDQHIYVCRSLNGAAWKEEEVLTDERIHPFSQLAAVTRGTQTVAVFFIDERGCLAVVFWATAAKWPSWKRVALENQPALLSGTALAAVSPSDQEILVFGVGRDLRLHFLSYSTSTRSWTSPAPLGTLKEFVAPHARIAAHVAAPDRIEVVALTDDGRAAVYPLTRTGAAFQPAARIPVDNPPAPTAGTPAAPSQSGRTSAPGWRLNPFGDLAILRGSGGTSVIYAAGLRDGNHQILRREVRTSATWEVFTS